MAGPRCRVDAIAGFAGATQAKIMQWLLGYAGTFYSVATQTITTNTSWQPYLEKEKAKQ